MFCYIALRGSTSTRIGLEVVEARNGKHHRGQRGLLSLLRASDPRSDDFLAETQLSRRKTQNRLQDADWSESATKKTGSPGTDEEVHEKRPFWGHDHRTGIQRFKND